MFFVTSGNFISFSICWTSETWIFMLCQNMVHHNPQKLIIQNTVLHKAYRVPQSYGLFTICHSNHTQHNIMHMYPMRLIDCYRSDKNIISRYHTPRKSIKLNNIVQGLFKPLLPHSFSFFFKFHGKFLGHSIPNRIVQQTSY